MTTTNIDLCGTTGLAQDADLTANVQTTRRFFPSNRTTLQTHPTFAQYRHVCTETSELLTIITPVTRPENLMQVASSILLGCIMRWVLVYDTTRPHELEPHFLAHQHKVHEIFVHETGISGNALRNRGLDEVTYGLVYFLDDDNIIHPHFWDILPNISLGHVTTFDQQRESHCFVEGR